ncbi:MAG: 3-keto-5-aminohexanoate cleavage protein [Pseudomonadota bacterium]
MAPIIITCAITGSIHTPSLSPHLPWRPDDIANEAIAAANAGAAILHLHARNPHDGRPSAKADDFFAFLPKIRAGTDAILNLSTGGSATMPLSDRLAGPLAAEPEMCSLNMGSMNFALYPMAERPRAWQFDWEEPFLRGTDDLVFKNTPRDIAHILDEMGEQRGARFEFECYDLSHLTMLKHFVDRGLATPPLFIQFVFGVLGGMAPEPETLTYLKSLTDKYFGEDTEFSVLGAGRAQFPMAAISAAMGGHVRVGLEDNLYIEKGRLAVSNAEQVAKVRTMVEALGRTIATPDEARALLALKGADKVAF